MKQIKIHTTDGKTHSFIGFPKENSETHIIYKTITNKQLIFSKKNIVLTEIYNSFLMEDKILYKIIEAKKTKSKAVNRNGIIYTISMLPYDIIFYHTIWFPKETENSNKIKAMNNFAIHQASIMNLSKNDFDYPENIKNHYFIVSKKQNFLFEDSNHDKI